ncbi:MAG: hypothetical protein ACOX23_02735 [Peptococcia bacterium]
MELVFLSRYKHLSLLLVLLAIGCAIGTCTYWQYFAGTGGQAEKERSALTESGAEQVITPETKLLLRENYALCLAHNLACGRERVPTGMVRDGFNQLTIRQLRKKYKAEAGWKVYWQKDKVVLELCREGLCPEHRKYWHLQSDDSGKWVAVYPGPAKVGRSGGAVKVTEIHLHQLPPDLQQEIVNGAWEFLSWEEVIATLDSLGEYIR